MKYTDQPPTETGFYGVKLKWSGTLPTIAYVFIGESRKTVTMMDLSLATTKLQTVDLDELPYVKWSEKIDLNESMEGG